MSRANLTHQVLLFVPDGLGVVPHEAHGEEKVNDREDGVQPQEVIAEGTHLSSGALPGKGLGLGLRAGLGTLSGH
jgi:hypothetical protein